MTDGLLTTAQVQSLLDLNGLAMEDFKQFMFGKTHAIGSDGNPLWYEWDVDSFMRREERQR